MLKKLLIMLMSFVSFASAAETVHKERSIYRNIVINESDNIRCMQFETRRKLATNQACIDLKKPQRLVFEYAHGTLAALAHQPKPSRVLILGLGGGVLSNLIHQLSPDSEIVSVDIDPAVVKLAKDYFNYRENKQVTSVIQDGRVFVKRALLKKETFDWIILDAFNGDYIPEHMMTYEFLSEVKQLLNKNGIVSANTFSTSDLYDYESNTYAAVFNKLWTYRAPTRGNRVLFACNCAPFKFSVKTAPAPLLEHLQKYDVDLKQVFTHIDDKVDWQTDTQILTDEYSPANLLK
ncbi:spermidine synthase [Gayadomonas joobiniege]|uniref:spermidine synthase n=1 Tax=Gayadomonas joobiniege TaxID=1234606 RepID=UPI000366B8E8|nr:fused MFS/spermidine synthase [Gayadomonas joobiniege]